MGQFPLHRPRKRRLRRLIRGGGCRTLIAHFPFAWVFTAFAHPEIGFKRRRGRRRLSPDRHADLNLIGALPVTAVVGWFREQLQESGFQIRELDTILRTFRARDAGCDGGQVEFQLLAVINLALRWHAEQSLGTVVILVGPAQVFAAAGCLQVLNRFFVDGKEAHGRSVFGRHVRDGRAVDQRQCGGAGSEEFNELSNHLGRAQQLGDR